MEVLVDYIEHLDWIAVFIAALASLTISMVWYSDMALGKAWRKAVGSSIKTKVAPGSANVAILTALIATAISTTALAILVDVLEIRGFVDGAVLGAMVAGGLLITSSGVHQLLEKRKANLFLINAVGDVVAFAVAGGLLALF